MYKKSILQVDETVAIIALDWCNTDKQLYQKMYVSHIDIYMLFAIITYKICKYGVSYL